MSNKIESEEKVCRQMVELVPLRRVAPHSARYADGARVRDPQQWAKNLPVTVYARALD
jgi:hypothetical protein